MEIRHAYFNFGSIIVIGILVMVLSNSSNWSSPRNSLPQPVIVYRLRHSNAVGDVDVDGGDGNDDTSLLLSTIGVADCLLDFLNIAGGSGDPLLSQF